MAHTVRLQWVDPLEGKSLLFAHLARLDVGSRRRRFGGGLSLGGLESYAQKWAPLACVALVDEEGEWRGVLEVVGCGEGCAELALSIEADWRGQGWGERLIRAASQWGAARSFRSFVVVMATHNPQMSALAKKAGADCWVRQAGGMLTASWTPAVA